MREKDVASLYSRFETSRHPKRVRLGQKQLANFRVEDPCVETVARAAHSKSGTKRDLETFLKSFADEAWGYPSLLRRRRGFTKLAQLERWACHKCDGQWNRAKRKVVPHSVYAHIVNDFISVGSVNHSQPPNDTMGWIQNCLVEAT